MESFLQLTAKKITGPPSCHAAGQQKILTPLWRKSPHEQGWATTLCEHEVRLWQLLTRDKTKEMGWVIERITEDNGDIAVPWETESLCFALGCLDQVAILASDIGSAKIIAEACYPRPANNMGFFHWVNSF
jgi:hypothetical protein